MALICLIILYLIFKATFDSVDRGKLIRGKGNKEVESDKEKRSERKFDSKSGENDKRNKKQGKSRGKMKEEYWTPRRVKQKCPLSSMLFNILQAKEYMAKRAWGGIKLGGGKYTWHNCRWHTRTI